MECCLDGSTHSTLGVQSRCWSFRVRCLLLLMTSMHGAVFIDPFFCFLFFFFPVTLNNLLLVHTTTVVHTS